MPQGFRHLLFSSMAGMPREGEIPPLTHRVTVASISPPVKWVHWAYLSISKGASSRITLEFKVQSGAGRFGAGTWFLNGIT